MLRSRMISRMIRQQCLQIRSGNCVRPCINGLANKLIIREQNTLAVEDGYIKKFMKAVGWMDQSRTRLKLTGYFLYESIPTKVQYADWFEGLELPDTFASWFNITELHVWMLMVRYMAEDIMVSSSEKSKYLKGDGHFVRNCIIEAMWADVATKIKLLETCVRVFYKVQRDGSGWFTWSFKQEFYMVLRAGSGFNMVLRAGSGFYKYLMGANPAIARKQVGELSEQFQAALVAYDEGLSDDKVLAAAVWRRFYMMSEDARPEHVERIVKLIRHQISLLDKIPGEDLKWNPEITWLSILGK